MARILAAIFVAIAAAIPLSAGALGLGEIDLKSALNQPFRAAIPVSSEAPGELEALRVEIASAGTFQQFGLDRAAFLADFTFEIVGTNDGAAIVQIASQAPVVEPFVTLLLEVSWAQGRLLREYTVLLDPPVFADTAVEPAVTAPTAGLSAPAPMSSADRVPDSRVAAPARAPVRGAAPQDDGGVYGPVERNDTLWAIAGRFADDASVSRNQMMLAIYQANPEAFAGNINRLKAGMILRVPGAAEVALGSREATAEVRRQNSEWRGADARRPEDTDGGRLRLVPPPERDAVAAGPDTGDGSLATAADARSARGTDERVRGLERELAESQRQLQLRNQELAALQQQLADVRARTDAPVSAPAPELVPEFAADEAPVAQEPMAEESAADVSALDEPVAAAESPATEPAPVDVTPAPVERETGSGIGALFTNPLVYISLVIVLLIAWLLVRNRSKGAESETGRWEALDAGDEDIDEDAYEATTRLRATPVQDETFVVEEERPSEATDDGTVAAPFTDMSSEDWGGLMDEAETPLERTISTDSAVNLDQADPIAEADFHMAYGLYDQAADLLTRAVEVDPERKDLRMKLLEVFFIWENRDGFLKSAQALQERIDEGSDPDWNKVLIMGKQICPDESLFAGDTAPMSADDGVDLEFGEDGGADQIDFSLDDAGESSADMQFDSATADLDLDLTGEGDGGDTADSGILDFDIGGEDEVTQVASPDDLDFPVDAPTMETPTIESPQMDGESTMETPTIESPQVDDESTMETPTIESLQVDGESTMETPTIESPTIESPTTESTMETPTIESPVGQWDGEEDGGGTAEIDLDDLGLDLAGLDDAALDVDLGDIDEEDGPGFTADELDFEVSDDDTQQHRASEADLNALSDDVDSTAEMRNLDVDETAEDESGGDTREQPAVGGGGDTAEQPRLKAVDDDPIDIGELVADDDLTTGIEDAGGGVEGATMTEVGTKLDLARAYIDMGDPDGARSILNEVLEEAGTEQRQEAQQLLDDLDG